MGSFLCDCDQGFERSSFGSCIGESLHTTIPYSLSVTVKQLMCGSMKHVKYLILIISFYVVDTIVLYVRYDKFDCCRYHNVVV